MSMANIPISELKKIPYLNALGLSGRFIASLSFYNNNEWELWFLAGDELLKVQGEPAESSYFAERPVRDGDIYFDLFNFLAQRGNFPFIQKAYRGLVDDLHNLSASLEKLDFFYQHRKELSSGISRIVSTEVEYIFTVCRSVFDLLQEIISRQWKNIQVIDTSIKKSSIPETFSKAILFEGKPMGLGDFTKRYGLPEELDKFYCRYIEFFLALRSFRDGIAHRGSSIDIIFSTDRGFAVSSNLAPFSKFKIWSEEHKLPNDLCSLRPAIGYFIHQTLCACEDFSQTIQQVIKFPEDTATGMQLFLRGYFTKRLIENVTVVEKNKWWDE